jgi:hypothetical protein
MRAAIVVGLVAVIAVGMASSQGWSAEKKAQVHHLSGELASVDAAAKSLTVKETMKDGKTKDVVFTASDKTKVTVHGKAGKLEDLKPGDAVKVSYEKNGAENQASAISVVQSPAKKS